MSAAPLPLLRVEVPTAPADLLTWLASQTTPQRWYWQSRDGQFEVAALGVAHQALAQDQTLDALQAMLTHLGPHSSARWYGGVAFDSDAPDISPEWSAFGRGFWILPAVEWLRRGSDFFLAFHFPKEFLNQAAVIEKWVSQWVQPSQERYDIPFGRPKPPEMRDWQSIANHFFQATELDKVVPARFVDWQMQTSVCGPLLLRHLMDQTGPGFAYYLQPQAGVAFAGCSPELLLAGQGDQLTTEAVAGTAVGDQSLATDKDREEHLWVVRHVRDALARHCNPVWEAPAATELTLPYARHWQAVFRGTRHAPLQAVFNDLFPTPAVAGYPVAASRLFLRTHEPFSRGWYAGAVGWVSVDALELAVAIRSALVTEGRVRVFAGAGFVKCSDAASEWAETENKMEPWRVVLAGNA
jgi:menaquinone-specific isochorismate synthase